MNREVHAPASSIGAVVAAPAHCAGIPLLPLHRWRVRLECLAPTRTGPFPEVALASLLLSAESAHKDTLDALSIEVGRTGQHHYLPGEQLRFTLAATEYDAVRCAAMLRLLHGLPASAPRAGTGCAFADNWRCAGIEPLDGEHGLDDDAIRDEAARWRGVSRLRLRFTAPLRIKAGRDGARGRLRYCAREADVDDAVLAAALTNSLVSLKFALALTAWQIPNLPLRIRRKRLLAIEPGQGPTNRKPLGAGLRGELDVEWREPPDAAQWEHLVLLQYLGVGQGRAFGLGRLQLETLDGVATKKAAVATGTRS